MELLITAGSNPGAKHFYSFTPLYYAVQRNNPEIVKALLDGGADPKEAGSFGNTLLHIAAIYESTDVVELLIEAGVDVNSTNSLGNTPLGYIKARGYERFESLLKNFGAVE